MRISDGCDPNAHKLIKRFSHDFSQPTSLGHVIEAKPYRLDSTQRVIQSQRSNTATPKLVLATYRPSLWEFRDDIRTSKPSHNISQLKRLMIMRVKMSRVIPKQRCSISCSRQHYANALLCLEGLEMIKSWRPLSSIGWRRMSNINPQSSPESR